MKTYFTYKIKYQEDGIHFNTPFDIQLESLTGISTTMQFVAQGGENILAYLDYKAENEATIRAAINSKTIKTDYFIIEKTLEEAKTFINTTFPDVLISNEIVGDMVKFELIPPETILTI